MTSVTLRIPDDVLEGIDKLVKTNGFASRTDFILEGINEKVTFERTKSALRIVKVTAENIDEIADDIKIPQDEAGLREFIEDNKRHHRRGH